jgi:hypothetical protein
MEIPQARHAIVGPRTVRLIDLRGQPRRRKKENLDSRPQSASKPRVAVNNFNA